MCQNNHSTYDKVLAAVIRIVLEGVTGAGKTQTLHALNQNPDFVRLLGPGRIFEEEQTFGEAMTEIGTSSQPGGEHLHRMENVLAEIERISHQRADAGFVLERFHPSYYALLPEWDLYADIDQRLARLGFTTVLLKFPASAYAARSLDREELAETPWSEDLHRLFGSRSNALEAIARSVQLRGDAIERSALPHVELSTADRDWTASARAILAARPT